MHAFITSIPGTTELPALVIEPKDYSPTTPVLLFLHGAGEVGRISNHIPLVCLHLAPPFQALLGRLSETLVIAPQAPASFNLRPVAALRSHRSRLFNIVSR